MPTNAIGEEWDHFKSDGSDGADDSKLIGNKMVRLSGCRLKIELMMKSGNDERLHLDNIGTECGAYRVHRMHQYTSIHYQPG